MMIVIPAFAALFVGLIIFFEHRDSKDRRMAWKCYPQCKGCIHAEQRFRHSRADIWYCADCDRRYGNSNYETASGETEQPEEPENEETMDDGYITKEAAASLACHAACSVDAPCESPCEDIQAILNFCGKKTTLSKPDDNV